VVWNIKNSLLICISITLLLSGSALFVQQIKMTYFGGGKSVQTDSPSFSVALLQGQTSDLQGAFAVDSVDNYEIQRDGKDAFSLLVAHYKDSKNQKHRALLFPKNKQETAALISPTGIRESIWQEAGSAIKKNTPVDATILSWWDDGQRINFLSGREVWISKPSDETFNSPIWKQLQGNLLLATKDEKNNLIQMARWLAMDSEKALAEIMQAFGTERPVYLLVTNDLLLRLGELADYGAANLEFNSTSFQANDNLHGDIARIREWAGENGNGNYLVQKEGGGYHVWSTPKESDSVKRTLLVRLLPFVDSLKKLPDGVQLVYQSHWGGYLSIYRLN
jgi:hydroxylamine oxidation protein HaoB